MKMHRLQKWFINSKLRDQKNLRQVEKLFYKIDLSNIQEVLEIGCGDGLVSAYLASNYKINVVGTDIDPDQIKLARKNHGEEKNLIFFEANAKRIPLDDNKFDMVLALNVFHHVGDWVRTLEEINRVLKSTGFFIFTGFTYSKFAARVFGNINKDYDVFTMSDITRFLRNKNFEIVCVEKPLSALPIGGFKHEYHRAIYRKNSSSQ